jgi:hypothetical protein
MSQYSDRQMNISSTLEGMGRDMWNWAQGMQETLGSTFQQYLGMAMPAAQENFSWGRKMRDAFAENVMPAMDSLFADAERLSSKEEQLRQRSIAAQDVATAADAKKAAAARKLASFGTDPSEVAANALDKKFDIQTAAAQALAANQAGMMTEERGRQATRDAAMLGGQLYGGEAATAYQQGANIGLSGINAGSATTQAGVMAGQGALPYYTGASGAVDSAANITGMGYDQQLAYAEDQRASEANLGGWGDLIGMGVSMIPGIGPVAGAAVKGAMGAAEGGPVQAPGGPTSDGGALVVSDGEYVIPADVVRRLGTNHFDKMIEKETGRPPPGLKQAIPVGGR